MKYAYINTHTDKRVLDWIDTEALNHVLPDAEYLHPCTEDEWALSQQPGDYRLANGRIEKYDPAAEPAPVVVPRSCSPAQGLIALYALKGIEEDHVLAAIEAIPDAIQRYTVKIGYQRATTWERGSAAMQTMAQLLQLSEEDLDALFTYAAGVAV